MPLARWIGPFDALLPDNGILRVGDTMEVTDRDLESAHWEAVDTEPARPAFTPTVVPAPAPVDPPAEVAS